MLRAVHSLVLCCLLSLVACSNPDLTPREKKIFSSLSLKKLGEPTASSNKYATNPQAASLGEQLFNDPGLSSTGTFSCASCHQQDKQFTDGLAVAQGIAITTRNTPTIIGSAWNEWQYWDGRRDSLWSQALVPIEAAAEMGSTRTAAVRYLLNTEQYATRFQQIFGPSPLKPNHPALQTDAAPYGTDEQKRAWFAIDKKTQLQINTFFANIGKAISAYERTLSPASSRFEEFIEAVLTDKPYKKILSRDEFAGARLFINEKKSQCLECHNGPLMSNGDFHNVASANSTTAIPDFGRFVGMQAVLLDEFNCQGPYSDAARDECPHLQYMQRGDQAHYQGAFKTPTLRGISKTSPYFHDGRFQSLEQVVTHYANARNLQVEGQSDLRNFPMSNKEIEQLVAFLKTL